MFNADDNTSSYPNAKAVDSAIKSAAEREVQNGSRKTKSDLIISITHDRLMSRIFSDGENSRWVLKGGNGLLARIPNARSTKDIDVTTNSDSLEEAVAELIELANRDLGDFFRFQFYERQAILESDKQPGSMGTALIFNVYLGATERPKIKVDLVIKNTIPLQIEMIEPASRVRIAKLASYNYRIWPIEYQIAEKVAATLTKYASGESSRSRDLFDLLAIAQTQTINARRLSNALDTELIGRGLEIKQTFDYPASWWDLINTNYSGSSFLVSFQQDTEVRALLDRFLFPPTKTAVEYFWNPDTMEWATLRLNLPRD